MDDDYIFLKRTREFERIIRMSKYPIVILGYDLRETQEICRKFVRDNSINSVRRIGQCEFKFEVNGNEIWIMHKSCYDEWCKGRTYYYDEKLMHSGFELKE